MKPFERLTHLGRLRRMRRRAQTALDEYDFAAKQIRFLRHAGNTMFRVVETNPEPAKEDNELFRDGQYLLRIHQPGYQATDAIALEHCREDAEYPIYRDALLAGYTEAWPLPKEQSEQLELFLVAFQVYWSLWAAAIAHRRPEHQEVLLKRMERAARLVGGYLEEN